MSKETFKQEEAVFSHYDCSDTGVTGMISTGEYSKIVTCFLRNLDSCHSLNVIVKSRTAALLWNEYQ